MVIAVNLKITGMDNVTNLMKRLDKKAPGDVNDALFNYAKMVRQSLFKGAITDPRPLTQDRTNAATRIKAKRISKFKSVITMPKSLIYLDSMSPHHVRLKRGRGIVGWAKRNYRGNDIYGPRGGIRDNAVLFVKPHLFIQRALHKERSKLPNELRKGIKKAISGSRR